MMGIMTLLRKICLNSLISNVSNILMMLCIYFNLILNRFTAARIKNNVMPSRIKVSFHMKANPVPFNMIFFTMTINQRAGIMEENHWSTGAYYRWGK